MRYHGHARVSPRTPEAFAVCDRCGALYNHVDLSWQFDWQGPRLQNKRILVCQYCLDKPFEHNRTLILPPDPVAIANARHEPYVLDDNPISPIAFDPLLVYLPGSDPANIGNMVMGGGLDAPYYSVNVVAPALPSAQAALLNPSWSQNWVGKFWSFTPVPPMLPGFTVSGNNSLKYGIGSFDLQAPSDQTFLSSGNVVTIAFYGWDGTNWNLLWTGNSTGMAGELVIGNPTDTTPYYAHAITIPGDGSQAAVSGLRMNAVTGGIMAATVTTPGSPLPTTPTFVFMGAIGVSAGSPIFSAPSLIAAGGIFSATSLLVGSPILGNPPLITSGGNVVAVVPLSFVDSAPLFGTPAISQGHTLLATAFVDSGPLLDTPAMGQVLFASALTAGAPVLGTPTLNQVQVLSAVGFVDSAPVLGSASMFPQALNFTVTGSAVTPFWGAPLLTNIGPSLITLNPATPLVTRPAVVDQLAQFGVALPATSLVTSKAIVDTIPTFLKH